MVALLRRHNMLPLLRHDFTDNCLKAVDISDEEQKKLLQSFCQQHKLDSNEALATHIQNRGLTERI